MLKGIAQIVGGIVLSALLFVWSVINVGVYLIGLSTTPDDYEALIGSMPTFTRWLVGTPWWVPSALMLAAFILAGWLIYRGAVLAGRKEVEAHPHPTESRVGELITLSETSMTEKLNEALAEMSASFPSPSTAPISLPPSIDQVVSVVGQTERAKFASQLQDRVSQLLIQQEAAPNDPIRFGGMSSPLRFYEEDWRLIGTDVEEMRAFFANKETQIMGDASYFLIQDGEPFTSGDTKRQYHKDRQKLEYLLARSLEASVPPNSRNFLMAFSPLAGS